MFPLFDCFVKNNGRQYEGSTTLGSPHACVGKERKFIAVTKLRNEVGHFLTIEIDIKPSSKHDIFGISLWGACVACVSKLRPNRLERIYACC